MPIILIKGSCVETPLYTMCWINEDGDKGQVREQGEEQGGGGADTRREGLKEHSVFKFKRQNEGWIVKIPQQLIEQEPILILNFDNDGDWAPVVHKNENCD